MQEQGSAKGIESDDNARRDLQGYVSATRELHIACANLSPGQMVSMPDFTLLDSMAALQLMDPRMDSGIFPIPLHLVAECDRLEDGQQRIPFDPYMQLSINDLCWIMDRVWACELEWHSGASLSQTIHTCLYIHSLASIHPDLPAFKSSSSSEWLVVRVLRPFLIAALKSVGMVWDEMSKGNLVDGEDFNGDKAGVSLLEEVSPVDAILLMQEAIEAVNQSHQQSIIDTREANSLLSRLQLRKSFLECVFIFAKVDPTLRLGQDLDPIKVLEDLPKAVEEVKGSLSILEVDSKTKDRDSQSFQSPDFSAAPSAKAISAFDPWFSRRPSLQDSYNAPSAPPPLPLHLMSAKESMLSLRQLLAGFIQAKDLVGKKASWAMWKSFIDQKALQFQHERTMPYIRSLWQSFFCSDNVIGLHYTLDWLSDSFLFEIAGMQRQQVDSYTFVPVNGGQSPHFPPTSASVHHARLTRSMIDDFLNRLLGQLVNHLSSLTQNRSRGKRRLAAAYESLLEISMQAAAIDDSLEGEVGATLSKSLRFGPPVQLLTLDTMVHIVLSGFELDLYRSEECGTAYWVAQRIAEEKVEVLRSIIQVRKRQEFITHLLSDLEYTECIVKACSAMQNLFNVSVSPKKGDTLPWTPLEEDVDIVQISQSGQAGARTTDLVAVQKATFFKRYKWLRGKGRPESGQTLDSLWHAYVAHVERMEAKSRKQRLDDAITDLQFALTKSDLQKEQFGQLHALLHLNLQKILQACLIDEQQTSSHSIIPIIFMQHDHHPWFPIPYTTIKTST